MYASLVCEFWAYHDIGHNRQEKDPFRSLWRKFKAPNQPDEVCCHIPTSHLRVLNHFTHVQGIPLDPQDAMLNPPAAATPTPVAAETPRTPSTRPSNKHKSSSRIIPPEEDMRRLFEECKYAHGNAGLLSDALLHARPEDLQQKVVIKVR